MRLRVLGLGRITLGTLLCSKILSRSWDLCQRNTGYSLPEALILASIASINPNHNDRFSLNYEFSISLKWKTQKVNKLFVFSSNIFFSVFLVALQNGRKNSNFFTLPDLDSITNSLRTCNIGPLNFTKLVIQQTICRHILG